MIITAASAIISLALWLFDKNNKLYKIGFLVLMYFGATLMWTVDGLFSLATGEPFLEISANDTLLGITVVVFGIIAYAVVLLINKLKNNVLN